MLSKPKKFLEIGIFQGVTARNICELLYKIHDNNFKYIGVDKFDLDEKTNNEIIPSNNFKNPLKQFYYQYIIKENPYSLVEHNLESYKLEAEDVVVLSELILCSCIS